MMMPTSGRGGFKMDRVKREKLKPESGNVGVGGVGKRAEKGGAGVTGMGYGSA
jgi:hypothetical protein